MARMPFAIVLAPEAVEDLWNLKANARAMVRAALITHLKLGMSLRRQAAVVSKSYGGFSARIIVFALATFACSTTFQYGEDIGDRYKSDAEAWLRQFADPA
jgi:mRNA interferase RelE/StbE